MSKDFVRIDGKKYPKSNSIDNAIDRLCAIEAAKLTDVYEINFLKIRYRADLYRAWIKENNIKPLES